MSDTPEVEITKLTDTIAMYYDHDGQGTLVWDLFCTPNQLRVDWGCKPVLG